jgi:hypothetical protein
MKTYFNVFINVLGVLAFIATIFGVCIPDFFQENAQIVITATVTFLLVSLFWLIVIAFQTKTVAAPKATNGL